MKQWKPDFLSLRNRFCVQSDVLGGLQIEIVLKTEIDMCLRLQAAVFLK